MSNMNVDYVTLHYRSVLNDFSNQFVNEEFSDCILNAEGRSLKVHKAMLCAQSSFLEKMILEHQNIGDLCFIIEGVSFDDLKSVVQFMYNGSAKLYKQNFGSFLVVAELLGVKWLDRVQILSETEPSSQVTTTNVSQPNQTIPKPVNIETQPISVFRDITNSLDTKAIKRKKHMKNKKHCKRSKCVKEDHRSDRRKHKLNHTLRRAENRDTGSGKQTHLADMDENTFCTALGLKKTQLQSRDNSKPDSATKTDAKIFAKSKSVPPLIKINREITSKSNVESFDTRDANMFVSEINTVYIEDKNLSFLNIGANELCIRENNIEIECDVLDASSSQFVIDKQPVANIVELREENIIQAEFVDINPD